jgi:biopolymer transport protein ExbB
VNWLVAEIGAGLLAQAENAAQAPQLGDAAAVQSVWDFVVKGGPMMIPIGICSLIALTVTIERLISLRRVKVIPTDFLPELKKRLNERGAASALEHCQRDGSAVSAVFSAGIKRLGEPIERLEKHIEEAGLRAVQRLRKYLRVLSVIASIAPLMGLLGTIFGMIRAFQTVAGSAEALGRTELLARGIYEAMITTAAGLLVAIPTLIAYHWLAARIERLVAEIDEMTVEFLEEYAYGQPGGAAHARSVSKAAASAAAASSTFAGAPTPPEIASAAT